MRRLLRWGAWIIGSVVVGLIVLALVTVRFGNVALYPPPAGASRIEVLITSNSYHAGIVIPREAIVDAARKRELSALSAVAARFESFPRIEFGWGDEGFYTRVPTTRELTLGLALRALFRPGNPSVLHVVGLEEHPRKLYPDADVVALALGEDGFERLAVALDRSFARSGRNGTIEELGRGLYGPSLFYRAVGSFSILKVCNHWIADLLDAAGVPTAPVLATLPQGLLWDLSWRAGAKRLPASAS